VPAQPARAFGDSVGVNVRLTWTTSSYGHYDALQARLRELGVRYVIDGLCPTCEYQIDRLRRLADDGIRATLGPSALNEGSASMQAGLRVIRDRLRDAVVAVSAPNEPDISGDPQWIEHTRAYQAELYLRVKGDPALAHLPVLGPSLVHRESRAALGDLSGYLDRGNLHPYPGGTLPLANLEDERQLAALVAGNKPLVATETGYHNDLASTDPHRPASETATAIYTPRLVLEGFLGGLERTHLFQLLDPWSPAQAEAYGIPPSDNSFGLLRWDLSPKPSFLALRNLMWAVDAGAPPVASPAGVRFSLEGADPTVRQLLLRSADGWYALVLWRQVSVWDRDMLHDLSPAPNPVEVVLGEPMALAQRIDPVDSPAERERWTEPRRIPVDLAGAPVVLRLTPPGVPVAAPLKIPRARLNLSRTKKRQRLRGYIVVKVSCTHPCASVSARGRLAIGRKGTGRRRLLKLRPARKRTRNGAVTLRLRIRPKARRAAARALKRGRRVRATVIVTARSASGAKLATARKKIVLVRRRG
jgi:hypothetical protein